ncbi:3'-5' exonuclease [Nocardia sp. NPDC050710]|uniref:3'-5' exonuclease n=1 Tax=Nocardia sp. NPDC050710 TaxID=3157220 RepID=UPI0033FE4EFC
MGERLINDLAAVVPVVIDFEYTTPKGAAYVPIEVAVQTLRVQAGQLVRDRNWTSLMRPADLSTVTAFDIGQTGITPQMLADQAPAAQVMAELDRLFTGAGPYVLFAHHAPAEAGLIYALREHCPNLARIDLIDTVRLARNLYLDVHGGHGLDSLMRFFRIPAPANRHRAMADVEVTTDLLIRMVTESDWHDLRQLRELAGYQARAAQPDQASLFD